LEQETITAYKYTVDQKGAGEMVARVMDAGVNLFDTAVSYADGQSETILGKARGARRKTCWSPPKLPTG
jgi:aryl-alcohol dehydrogenase-like predicted oxidoreductase